MIETDRCVVDLHCSGQLMPQALFVSEAFRGLMSTFAEALETDLATGY